MLRVVQVGLQHGPTPAACLPATAEKMPLMIHKLGGAGSWGVSGVEWVEFTRPVQVQISHMELPLTSPKSAELISQFESKGQQAT